MLIIAFCLYAYISYIDMDMKWLPCSVQQISPLSFTVKACLAFKNRNSCMSGLLVLVSLCGREMISDVVPLPPLLSSWPTGRSFESSDWPKHLKIASDIRPLDMVRHDSVSEEKPSSDIYVNEGESGVVGAETFYLRCPCVTETVRLGRRMEYIYNSHLIRLMHSDLFSSGRIH